MTSKNTSPEFNNATKNRKTNASPRKRLIIILLLLLLAIIGYLAWSHFQASVPSVVNQSAVEPNAKQPPVKPTPEMSVNSDNLADSVSPSLDKASDTNAANEKADIRAPEAKAILEAPLPATNSLAKEEIDRLEDEYQRLKEKEELAAEQVEMNKKLTEMKAEQIKLLEQQIAQLEAVKVSQ